MLLARTETRSRYKNTGKRFEIQRVRKRLQNGGRKEREGS
jgi:hypothetical protein